MKTTNNDFSEVDNNLNMSDVNDSVVNTYTSGGDPIETANYTIFNKIVYNIPVINSTNNSNFVTGILWDSSDDLGNGQFDLSDQEDVLFVTKLNPSTQGRYGIYDFRKYIYACRNIN